MFRGARKRCETAGRSALSILCGCGQAASPTVSDTWWSNRRSSRRPMQRPAALRRTRRSKSVPRPTSPPAFSDNRLSVKHRDAERLEPLLPGRADLSRSARCDRSRGGRRERSGGDPWWSAGRVWAAWSAARHLHGAQKQSAAIVVPRTITIFVEPITKTRRPTARSPQDRAHLPRTAVASRLQTIGTHEALIRDVCRSRRRFRCCGCG